MGRERAGPITRPWHPSARRSHPPHAQTARSEVGVQTLTPYGRYSARTSSQPTSASCSFDPDLQRSLRHGFPPLFAMGFCPRYRPCFLGIPPRRTLKHDTVFRSSLFSDSQIPWHRQRHELRRHGGHQKARSHLWWPGQNEVYPVRADSVPFSGNDPQPIRSITPSRFPSPSTLTSTLKTFVETGSPT